MAEHKLLVYLIVMMSINVILFLAQIGVNSVNPAATFWENTTNSPASTFLHDGTLGGGMSASQDDMEFTTTDSVEPDTGNIFTDTVKSISNWFNRMDIRFGIVTGLFSQPYGFMRDIGIPIEICTAFGVLWYMVAVILFVSFLKGGDAN